MNKPAIYFNDFVSLAVMLLMVVALVFGQATADQPPSGSLTEISPVATMDDRAKIQLSGYLGDKALQVSIDIVTDLSHFRGEDE